MSTAPSTLAPWCVTGASAADCPSWRCPSAVEFKLCDIAQSVIVGEYDCGSRRGIVKRAIYKGEQVDVPLRDQRRLFTAAGYVPPVTELPLSAPALEAVNTAIEAVLAGHEPYPALVVDGGWDLIAANDAAYRLLDDVAPELLEPPVNVVRLSLSPRGLGARIENLEEWRDGIMTRIRHEYESSGDARLGALLAEFPPPAKASTSPAIVLTVRVRSGDKILSFLTMTTVFGTPRDVTVSELAIEALYPADDATRRALQPPRD